MFNKLILSPLIFFSTACFCQGKFGLENLKGTWMNVEYYNLLTSSNFDEAKANDIEPRLLFIDGLGNYNLEYRFEQKTRLTKHPRITFGKDKNIELSLKNSSIKCLSDTIVAYENNGIVKTFRKISNNYSCISCGMQIFFQNLFLRNQKTWKVSEFRNDSIISVKKIKVDGMKIKDYSGNLLWQYSFLDIYKENHGNMLLYCVEFFNVNKSLMKINQKIFGIKMNGNEIDLYEKNEVRFILSPINN